MHLLTRALITLSAIPSLSLTWVGVFGIAGPFGTAATIVLVSVSPASASVSPGQSRQFSATARYPNGSVVDISPSAEWSSSDRSIATVALGGRASGLSGGDAILHASFEGGSASARLHVSGPVLESISVNPASVAPISGIQQHFKATGRYGDHSQTDLTYAVDWTSTNPAVAMIDSSGLAQVVSAGATTIQASAGSISGEATLAVPGPLLVSISVAPAVLNMPVGGKQQLIATGTYHNGIKINLTHSVVWTSNSVSAVTVSESGLATAVAPGSAKIQAAAGFISNSAFVTTASAAGDAGGCDGKGNCYIYAGAKGAGTGADWSNAYTGLGPGTGQVDPGSMIRGITYWVARGEYGAQTFGTPNRGTKVITLKGATATSHGSAADWNDAYAGQAVFGVGSTRMLTDYWTFDGQARGKDWQSGYTIKFDLNGVNTHGGVITTRTITGAASHLRFDYVEVRGSNMNYTKNSNSTSNCGDYCDSGFATGSPTNDLYVGHSWIHDVGDTQFQSNINTTGNSNGSDWIIEYNYISRDHTGDQSSGNHSEAFSSTAQNMIVRYNYFQDIISSGVITDASGGTPDVGPWYIYGNIVFWTDNAVMNGRAAGLGDGLVSMFGENMHGTSYIVGNTIANLGHQPYCNLQGTACAMYFLYTIGEDSGTPTWIIQNNLVWKVQGRCVYGSPKGWSFQADYNSAYQSPGFDNCGHHAHNSGGSPFLNWNGGGTQLAPYENVDFQLAEPTRPGVNAFSAIPPGCTPGVNCANVSFTGIPYGVNGNYDRGAMQTTQPAETTKKGRPR